MNIQLKPGNYVLAVSGGVDSVVLLDLVSKLSDVDFIVAHFDHGIRQDSKNDRTFAGKLAAKYKLSFYYEEGNLGSEASEAEAREARYKFLKKTKHQTGASAIVTAHHQDDVIETAIINLLRGTKAKGLSSLKSTEEIVRPLLDIPKAEILAYAKKNNLEWREDPTNQDQKYLRNYVRHSLVPKLSEKQRKGLLGIIKSSAEVSEEVSSIIKNLLPQTSELSRTDFIKLPHSVACELLASWLRSEKLAVDQRTIERLAVGLKTARNGAILDINKNFQFLLGNGIIRIQKRDKF